MTLRGSIIDIQDNGFGDAVIAAWLVTSTRRYRHRLLVNGRNRQDILRLLSVEPNELTDQAGMNWTRTPHLGLQYEYARSHSGRARFDLWAESLGLPDLTPIRPTYKEDAGAAEWAAAQWQVVTGGLDKPRALIFPTATRSVRQWPIAYYCDLVDWLSMRGWAVAAAGERRSDVDNLNCHWWYGSSLSQVAAMINGANVVITNDTGPAHLAGTIGVRTISICGPTNGAIVFGHDVNVLPVALQTQFLACVGCHFSKLSGYRHACEVGGCQALMRLDPATVGAKVIAHPTNDVSGHKFQAKPITSSFDSSRSCTRPNVSF